MKRFNGAHWRDHVLQRVCPRVEQFGSLVLSRVLPAFDGINEEAHALECQLYKELMSSVHGGVDQPRDLLDAQDLRQPNPTLNALVATSRPGVFTPTSVARRYPEANAATISAALAECSLTSSATRP